MELFFRFCVVVAIGFVGVATVHVAALLIGIFRMLLEPDEEEEADKEPVEKEPVEKEENPCEVHCEYDPADADSLTFVQPLREGPGKFQFGSDYERKPRLDITAKWNETYAPCAKKKRTSVRFSTTATGLYFDVREEMDSKWDRNLECEAANTRELMMYRIALWKKTGFKRYGHFQQSAKARARDRADVQQFQREFPWVDPAPIPPRRRAQVAAKAPRRSSRLAAKQKKKQPIAEEASTIRSAPRRSSRLAAKQKKMQQ